MSQVELSNEDITAFRRDGAICVRDVIDSHWRDILGKAIGRSIDLPTTHASVHKKDANGARFFMDTVHWGHVPEFMKFAAKSPGAGLVGQALGADRLVFLEQDWFFQDGGSSGRTPWHQDLPYYDLDGSFATLWVPLDSAPDEVRLELIAGSHRWDKLYVPHRFDGEGAKADEAIVRGKTYTAIPDIDAARDDYQILGWALEPGDAILFHCRTIHSGAPTNTTAPFRRTATRFAVAEDCRLTRKGVPWSDFYKNLPLDLEDSQLVADNPDYFPMVWSAG